MRRDGHCGLFHSEVFLFLGAIVSGGEVGAAAPRCRSRSGRAIMVAATIVIAAALGPVQVGGVDGIDPDDRGLLLSVEVEHWPRCRANVPGVVAVALPPALRHTAVVQHRRRIWIGYIRRSRLRMHHEDVRIHCEIEVQGGKASRSQLSVDRCQISERINGAVSVELEGHDRSEGILRG